MAGEPTSAETLTSPNEGAFAGDVLLSDTIVDGGVTDEDITSIIRGMEEGNSRKTQLRP